MRIFVSYSHQDEGWKEKVCTQLGVLAPVGLEVWDDRRIAGGDDWLPAIEQAIAGCNVAVLLISAHFLTSKFILGNEVPALLKRRQEQGVRVIPVIVSDCAWRKVAWLKPIQAQPTDGKPLDGMTKPKANSALKTLAESLHDLAGKRPGRPSCGNPPPDKIDLTHLPAGAQHFLGREADLANLDAAWESGGGTAVVELIAPGGTGKTALVKRWLDGLRDQGWRGAIQVYAWSFYSQGTDDVRQASEDHFLAEALTWFGVEVEPTLNPWDKGRRLAEAVAARRTLLILDGVEPLQYPPGPLAGELRAPGLKALLTHLASAGQPGLCVLSSREFVKDVAEWIGGSVVRIDLGNLNEPDGARLLHKLGARRAGAADIGPDDAELQAASREVRGHALTLSLLGAYLALAYEGDIRQRDQVEFRTADDETAKGHAFRVIAAYERWFAAAGEAGARQLAALRLLGFFDRPASAAGIDALRAAPAIAGLTEALQGINPPAWRATLKHLESLGLIAPPAPDGSLDAHPLVREYLAETLKTGQPEAWQEGHHRLYKQLKASAPHRPEGLAALQPLYQAVAHGCQAGLWQQACDEVYVDRILRGAGLSGYYNVNKLGGFGDNLAALACFFVEPWRRPAPAFSEDTQAWLRGETAFSLRALGRLEDALEPMQAAAEMWVKLGNWKNAAAGYNNLSELQLSLGRVAEAVADAGRAVDYADRNGDAFWRMGIRTALADALHQQGEAQVAAQRFADAEAMQAEWQPQYPLLKSLAGFRYCDLLLAGAVERTAWRGPGEGVERCGEVAERGKKMFEWRGPGDSLLDIALDHLTLARCALYADLLQGQLPGAIARNETEQALAGLRAAGYQSHLPDGLLTRAWLYHRLDKTAAAAADLNEAEQIARRGSMKLHLADIHLTRARLFHDREALAAARKLIEDCGYRRRLGELEDAEAAPWAQLSPL